MTEKVLSFIERNKLLKDGDSVIVALSGELILLLFCIF